MVQRSNELSKEIAETREEMGERLIELRRRGRRAARRTMQVAIIAGALAGAAVVGLVAYRMTRPPTLGERARRLVPTRQLAGLRLPSMRMYVNDKQVVDRDDSATEKLVVTAARAFGTAAATAAIGILLRRVTGRDESKPKAE
ncbi:MAG TPA: hypothetical protein VF137_06995 [Candidatus Dormibacteraeota bacterium]